MSSEFPQDIPQEKVKTREISISTLESEIVELGGELRKLPIERQIEIYESDKLHSREISDAVYGAIMKRGVDNVLDDNFWDCFMAAENDVLIDKKTEILRVLTFKKGDMQDAVSRAPEDINELYFSHDGVVIYNIPINPFAGLAEVMIF